MNLSFPRMPIIVEPNTGIMKEARVYGCLRVSILLMVESILNKNKNKNNKN